MSFDPDKYISVFDAVEVERTVVSVLRNDEGELRLRRELAELIADCRDEIILVVGPYGAGKSTLCQDVALTMGGRVADFSSSILPERSHSRSVLAIDDINFKWLKTPGYVDSVLERDWTILGEIHPLEKLKYEPSLPVEYFKRPFLKDDLVEKVLRTAYGFPPEIMSTALSVFSGMTHLFFSFNKEISNLQRMKQKYSDLKFERFYISWSNFQDRCARNYMTRFNFAGGLIHRLVLDDDLSDHEEDLALLSELGILERREGVFVLRSDLWKEALLNYHSGDYPSKSEDDLPYCRDHDPFQFTL